MPTPHQIELIRSSWARASAAPDVTGRLFYGRLFEIAPQTRGLFRGDMALQGRKLEQTLAFVVDHLDDPAVLLPSARDLAERHIGYGVSPAHYAPVGEALLWALGEALGPAFDEETRVAWGAAYAALLGAMLPAAFAGKGA